jgi:hypothetical protein
MFVEIRKICYLIYEDLSITETISIFMEENGKTGSEYVTKFVKLFYWGLMETSMQ